ncbi:MAG: cytochrome P450 [Pseudomonadales bacterium]
MSTVDLEYINQPNNTDLKHIPGEYGIPVLGKAAELFTDHLGFARRMYDTYGPLSRIQMATQKGVLAQGPDLAQQIFLDRDRNFSAKMGYMWSLQPFFGGSYLLGTDFEEHKFQRRIMQTGFKTPSMRGYVDIMNPVIKNAMSDWADQPDYHVYPNLKRLLMQTALKVFYGVDGDSDLANKLSQAFIDLTDGQMGMFRVELPGFKFYKGQKAKRLLRSYIASLIPNARENDGKDMLSYMAKETKPDGTFFSDEELIDHASFLLFAAHDTTTSTLNHLMYYLAKYPQWQDKIRAEGQSINGGKDLAYEDLDKCLLLEAAFNESQRLHPSVPVAVRRTIRDCEMAGHKVPANTVVFQFPIFTLRMADYWTNPDQFDPERLMPDRAEHKNHPFCFMPFGGGAHKCIGMHFAMMQTKLFVHSFLQTHKISLKPGYEPVFKTVPLPKVEDDLPLTVERI